MLTYEEACHFHIDKSDNILFYPNGLFGKGYIVKSPTIQRQIAALRKRSPFRTLIRVAGTFIALFLIQILMRIIPSGLAFLIVFLLLGCLVFSTAKDNATKDLQLILQDLPQKLMPISPTKKLSVMLISICAVLSALVFIQILATSLASMNALVFAILLGAGFLALILFYSLHRIAENEMGRPYHKVLYG